MAQAKVRQTIYSWMKAREARDMGGIRSKYASNVVAFDAIQQLQFKGADAYGKHWKACFEMCPGDMIFRAGELDIQAENDLAVVHGLVRCGMKDDNGDEKTSWMRSEEHTSELQSLMRISYAVFCLKKKKRHT